MTADPKPLRADAARNRDKLLAAANAVFAAQGLSAPMEQIARRAGVSIGTLYNHFPSPESFFDAIYPQRINELSRLTEHALADTDAWNGFVTFIEGLFALQAQDRGLNEAMAQRHPNAEALEAACTNGFAHVGLIITRAKDSGQLRSDFHTSDLATLVWAMSRVIHETKSAPALWRRTLAFFMDGLRSDAAHRIPVPPLESEQLRTMLRS